MFDEFVIGHAPVSLVIVTLQCAAEPVKGVANHGFYGYVLIEVQIVDWTALLCVSVDDLVTTALSSVPV